MKRSSCLLFSGLIAAGAILALTGLVNADEGGTSHSPITTPSGKSSDFDKKAPTGRVDPHSGTVIPDSPSSQSHPEQPSGIGEKGSGQTQTTMERSGGSQPSASESMSNASNEHGEGKTERAAKDLKSQKPNNR